MTTHVLQSCREPGAGGWQGTCLASVSRWCAVHGLTHRCVDDALFEYLPADLRGKLVDQPVVASDVARLRWMQAALSGGADTVVWLDADTLVIDPHELTWPEAGHAVGREVWVQRDGSRWRARRQVHNAFLMARTGDSFLPFYADTAERRVREHVGTMVPQLVGPKLLTGLHNLVGGPVAERAGVLSPAVITDLLEGGGPALRRFRQRSDEQPACVNLCASSLQRGELDTIQMERVIERLVADPAQLSPLAQPDAAVIPR